MTNIYRRLRLQLMTGVVFLTMIAGLIVLPGCDAPETTATAPSASPSRSVDIERKVRNALDGAHADRAAIELLTEVALHDKVKECMESNGYPYNPPVVDDGYQGWTEVPLSTTNLFTLDTVHDVYRPVDSAYIEAHGMGVLEQAQLHVPQPPLDNPGYAQIKPVQRQGYRARLEFCKNQVSEVAFVRDGIVPARVRSVKAALFAKMKEIVSQPEIGASPDKTSGVPGYSDCISKAGYKQVWGMPIATYNMTRQLVRSEIYGQPGLLDNDMTLIKPVDDPAVKAARAKEIDAAKADAECRRRVHDLAAPILTQTIREFHVAQAADFAAIDKEWAALRERADQIRRDHQPTSLPSTAHQDHRMP